MRLNVYEKALCAFEGHSWRYIKHLGDGSYLYRCTECGALKEKFK